MANAKPFVNGRLKRSLVVVFSKSYSPEGRICEDVLRNYNSHLPDDIFEWVNIEKRSDCSQVEDYLWLLSGKNNREVPLMFIKHRFVGGYNEILHMHKEGKLEKLLTDLKMHDTVADDDEDDARGKDSEMNQIIVRIDKLDDADVHIKFTDFVSKNDHQPDYDQQLQTSGRKSMKQLQHLLQQVAEEKTKANSYDIEDRESSVKEPEWIIISGKKRAESTIMSPEISAFVLKKISQTEIQNIPIGEESTVFHESSTKSSVINMENNETENT